MKKTNRSPEERAAARERADARVDGLKAKIDARLDDLAAALGEGRSEAFLSYLRFCGQFHRYSANNQLLIQVQAPEAQHVAGFWAWKKVGRSVKKGATGIAILTPRMSRDRDAAPLPDGKQPLRVTGFSYDHVFADYDTEGDPIPDYMAVAGDEQTHALLLDLIAKAQGAGVPTAYETCPAGVYGYSDGGRIVLDSVKCAAQPGTATRTFFHEWAHHVLHWKGEQIPAENRPDKKTRELEADAAAYALCSLHGVDARAQVADYVQGWGGKPDALRASAQRIAQTVKHIMAQVSPDDEDREADERAA